jgi:sporulation protein YlmC with PRC-barrel domain
MGEIEDVLVKRDGSVAYVMFEYSDDVWEISWQDQISLVPLSLLSVQPITQAAVLNIRATDVDSLPKVEEGLAIDTSEENWESAITSYWRNVVAVERGNQSAGSIPTADSYADVGESDFLPASVIRDLEVVNANGEWIGSVEEVMIDVVEANVAYLRLEIDEEGLFAEAEVAVPMGAFEFNLAEDQLVIDTMADELSSAPGYNEIPTEVDRDFLNEVEAYWAN